MQVVVVEHSRPDLVSLVLGGEFHGVGLEGNVGRSANVPNRPQVALGEIRLIGADFLYVEAVVGGVEKRNQVRGIVADNVRDLGDGDYIGLGRR